MNYTCNYLRIISCLGVLFIHGGNDSLINEHTNFFSRGVVLGAVPIFFWMSGVFLKKELPAGYVLARVKYLLTSYVLVNAALLTVVILVTYFFANVFKIDGFYAQKIEAGWLSVFGVIEHYPVAYQFWFIRDLALSFLVLRWVLIPLNLVGPLAIIFIMASCFVGFGEFLRLFFFALGCFSFGYAWPGIAKKIDEVGIFVGLAIGFFGFVGLAILYMYDFNSLASVFLVKNLVLQIFSCALFVGVARVITCVCEKAPVILSSSTYFVFAFHEPLLSMTISVFRGVFLNVWALYFVSILTIYFSLIVVYRLTPLTIKARFWFFLLGSPLKLN